jgi:hypothetical protein
MADADSAATYPELRDQLFADIKQHGLAAAFELHAREIVALHAQQAAPEGMLGHDLLSILESEPELQQLFAAPPTDQAAALEHESAAHAIAHAREDAPADASVAEAQRKRMVEHPELRESDGSSMWCVEDVLFQNWGRTVSNTPALTVVPRTKGGIGNVVRWASANSRTVRAAGYRHSWSSVFSADGQVLVSMLPLYDVEHLPAPEPPIDPGNELQGIEVVGTVVEGGVTKALCRIGAATTNEQFRRWCVDEQGGAWAWTIPLNVIMVEITWGGSNAPICHGAGRSHQTLSDLVTEVEFVNAKGELQVVSDPGLLRAAAGCFGLLGIVTSLTVKLDPMSYATLRPEKQRLALTIPPPPGAVIPPGVDMSGISQAELDEAWTRFVKQCESDYYAEWFWFPYQQRGWVNCWNNDGQRSQAQPYPGDWGTLVEQAEEYLAELATSTAFKLLPGSWQAKLFGAMAMANLPSGETVVTSLIEALHFRRGIQNFRVLDMELEIPVPARADNPSLPDWSIAQRAWWAAITNVLERSDSPMRVALEMRIMSGSGVTMAPQNGNLATCSIEVLTTPITPHQEWGPFMQDIVNLWTSYSDAHGVALNVRPHWAKQWQELRFRGRPAVEYLRDVAYADRIPEFRTALQKIAAEGGSPPAALRLFSNPLLDELFASVFD